MIAYLGWGSLVWQPDGLPVRGQWLADGPTVCVEFLRQSGNGRLTLVMHAAASAVTCFWVEAGTDDEGDAKRALREREAIPSKNMERHLGVWTHGCPAPASIPGLADWAAARGITTVLWTALPPKFNGVNQRVPSVEEAVAYLASLSGQTATLAEEYVRRAPPQIDTVYRREFAARLGWHPLPKGS